MKVCRAVIYFTTSRLPSVNLVKFTSELKNVFPNSHKIRRGAIFLSSLVDKCVYEGGTDLILCHEFRGQPDAIVISHLPNGPTAYFNIKKVIFFHKKKKIGISSSSPHILVDNLNSGIGKRLCRIFCSLFSSSNVKSKRIVSFIGKNNYISFRHYLYQTKKIKNRRLLLHELGPSFDLFPFKISLGHVGNKTTKIEWNFTSFLHSHRKKSFLYTSNES